MNFEIGDERRMLRDTLDRFLARTYMLSHRSAVAYAAPFHDPANWTGIAELGVLHALVGPDAGGMGGEGFDVAVVFEALGRALCPEPVLGALVCARLLAHAGDDTGPLLSGQVRYALAVDEVDTAWTGRFATVAVPADGGWAISGRKSVVYGGASADRLLVAARQGVFEVQSGAASVSGFGMIDGGNAAEVFLDATPARPVLDDPAALADAIDWGTLALCSEAVGAMDTAAAMLLEHLKTRKQFGRPLSDFQALQHRAVDLTIEIEQARSITILAASRMGGAQQSRCVSMAKNLIGRTARLVAEELIQMHGGIGMTWEHPASHFAKRLVMIDHQFGDTDHHLHRAMRDLRDR